MKIATIPMASIATKIGMKAMTNLVAKSFTSEDLERTGRIQRSNRFTTFRIYTMLSAPSTIL